ncbi:MAG: serine--tRNA ligase [Myxococcales bacterium]|nr:serine--tRNA ligase [Myxococcales bacterium]
MLDIREIRQDPDAFARRLHRRGAVTLFDDLLALDARRRELIAQADGLRQAKAEAEKGMRTADKSGPEFAAFREQMRAVADEIKTAAEALKTVEEQLEDALLRIPNTPDDAVPDGASEADNRVLRVVGEKPAFDFEPAEHWAIAERLGLLDFERAAKITGTRFAVYRGALARLERALISFMLDLHTTEHGYTEILPPFVVNHDSMRGTGQFPKFMDDAFLIERDGLALVPTAEVPVTNLHRDEIVPEGGLPIRYTAYTPCFRREAGGYGRDTRGLIRQHQFQKVELVQFCEPEHSPAAHEALTGHAEAVLQRLGLHYRVVDLCAADLGFSAQRTYDLEVWLPGQGAYREISSCSNFGPFQARRAAIRYRAPGVKKPQLLHTLNGSGLAIGRTVVALLENGQQADGTVRLPAALHPYMGGVEVIGEPMKTA